MTALEGYFVTPDAHGDDYVWREDGDHPVPVLGKVPVLREHPALWEAIVNLVGRKPEEPMPVGQMLDTILSRLGTDARVTTQTAAHETVFDLYTTGNAFRAKHALADSLGDPYVVVMRSNLVTVTRRPHV